MWQAEQLRVRDADYHGAKVGTFDPQEDADLILGKLNHGDVFAYLFRRFGYPRFGWDDSKHLVTYHITTPMAGVLLTVEPDVTGAGTFGYMLRDDIDRACEEEARKPFMDWMERFESWALKEHGIEVIRLFDADGAKLKRVWEIWGADKQDRDFASEKEANKAFLGDQEEIRIKYVKMYKKIEPHPGFVRIADLPDDSILKQCHTALCATIKDMLRPVYIRDVMIDIRGKLQDFGEFRDNLSVVKCADGSGRGVGGDNRVLSELQIHDKIINLEN